MANIDTDLLLELARSKEPGLHEVDAMPDLGELAAPPAAPDALDPRGFGSHISTEGGAVRDPYGLENEVRGSVDDIDANVARAREMYRPAEQSTGPGSREEYLLSMATRPGEDDVTKAAIFGALLGDQKERLADVRGRQSEYDKNLMGARDADRSERSGNAPADLATVEMLVRSGMSPEAATQLSQNSPALKLAGQGGLNVDLKRRAQDIGVRETVIDEAGKTGRNEQDNASALAKQKLANEAKKKKGGGGGGAPSAGIQKAKAAYLAARVSAPGAVVPVADVESYLTTGQPGSLSPATIEAIGQSAPAFDVIARDPKKLAALLTASEGREGRTPDANASTLANDVAKKQADPQKRGAAKAGLLQAKASLINAMNGWKSMTPRGREVLAKIGGGKGTLAQLAKDYALSPDDQKAVGAIQALANVKIKLQSGAAVSDGEWNRLAGEMGFASGDFSAFNSPSKITEWLKRAQQAYNIDQGVTLETYPGLLDKKAAH